MNYTDHRGCAISGATPAALEAYERALGACLSWRTAAMDHLGTAQQLAPAFTMARVLQAWLAVCSRDPRRVRSARVLLDGAAGLPANERERLHLSAIGAALADDYERALTLLGEVLRRYPRDVVALNVAHAFDYLVGDASGMRDRVAAVLPAWSRDLPGYHAVLAMHAFSLEECGDYDRAEDVAEAVLTLNPADARAHHVMAHVFEMTKRAEAGVRWMEAHIAGWSEGTVVATHCWWHLALFHLALGRFDRGLALYDQRIRAERSGEIADLIDAAALLWRVELAGRDTGSRWIELADAWAPHIDDKYCSFSDMHAMLAFVGARDWNRAQRLESVLSGSRAQPTRHGKTTRLLGLPACRALIAFGLSRYARATLLLGGLKALAYRLGGSHAQRDVLRLTFRHAIERFRRGRVQHVSPLEGAQRVASTG